MQQLSKQRNRGFGMLDIMLATTLLAGLIVLISSSFDNNKKLTDARSLASQLATGFDELIQQEITTASDDKFACTSDSGEEGLVTTLAPGYLQSLKSRGISLCDATVTIIQCSPGSGSDDCMNSSLFIVGAKSLQGEHMQGADPLF